MALKSNLRQRGTRFHRQAVQAFAWEDEIRLTRDGSLFTIGGSPRPDAEAILLEEQAEECRAELASNDVTSVKGTIQRYAEKSGLKISAGSIDEQLIGRALLRALAEKFDRDAEAYRRERLPYQLVHEAESDDESWEQALHDELGRVRSGSDQPFAGNTADQTRAADNGSQCCAADLANAFRHLVCRRQKLRGL